MERDKPFSAIVFIYIFTPRNLPYWCLLVVLECYQKMCNLLPIGYVPFCLLM